MNRFYRQTDVGYVEHVLEDDKVHARHVVDHSIARAVMERNKELQKNPGAVKTTSFGKLELDIPLTHMPMLDRFYPGLADPGHPDHKYQLRRFMASPASAPYRLQEHKPTRQGAGHIWVK